jgi:uncharacterized membrane protein (UPF0127 family)
MKKHLSLALILPLVLLALIALFAGWKYFSAPSPAAGGQPRLETSVLTVGSTSLSVELAVSEPEREQGLSGRRALAEGKGMLFFFDQPSQYRFWMPDMRFAIDIVWIGEDWKVADITENATPESFPATFQPKYPAKYVLEVPAGYAAKRGWREGTTVSLAP